MYLDYCTRHAWRRPATSLQLELGGGKLELELKLYINSVRRYGKDGTYLGVFFPAYISTVYTYLYIL
jgi:hypothetical protein